MDHILESYPQGAVHSTSQRETIINKKGFSETSNKLNKSLIIESLTIEGSKEPLKLTIEEVNATAVYLVDKFSNPAGLRFYLKVAWHIPRGSIDRLVVLAFERGKRPGLYFSALAKKEMER